MQTATGTATSARPTLAASLGRWEDRPLEEKLALRAALRRVRWRFQARPDQLPPNENWQTAYLSGGRGSGKSWSASNWFAEEIHADPLREAEGPGRWAIVAPTFADARDKCIESDESGLLRALGTNVREIEAGTSATVEKWNRSIGELHLKDGSIVHIDGADDGAYRIQGFSLRGVWADEIGLWKKWKTAWDESIAFALRKGRSRIIATGTPKRSLPARRLVKRLLSDPAVEKRRLRTADNWANLSEAFRSAVQRFIGTTLGAQELEGMLLENAEGALWQIDWIETTRVEEAPPSGWQSPPVIGVDPSDGTDDGAEHAFTVVGLGYDNDLYVIESKGLRGSPTAFARHVVLTTEAYGGRIVVEKNHGGQWLVDVFKRAMTDLGVHVPLKVVSASQGKLTRAEPVAALYEPRKINGAVLPGRVHHVGYLEQLEDQMVNFTGAAGETSPDALDSMVWALSEFTGQSFKPALPEHLAGAVPYPSTEGPVYDFVEQVRPDHAPAGGAVPWS